MTSPQVKVVQGNTANGPTERPPAFAPGATQTVDANHGGAGNINGEAGGIIHAYSTQLLMTGALVLPPLGSN